MRVTGVESLIVAVPLIRPVRLSRQSFSVREFNIVRVHTDEEISGTGYARGGRLVDAAVELELAPALVGADPLATEEHWDAAYERTALVGRGGAVLRGLSALDIALWDIKAKVAGLPLARLLGAGNLTVPAYASAGYYRDGQTPAAVAAEMAAYAEDGFRAVKIRIGGLPWREDVARVAAVRAALGDGIELAVDANQGYRTSSEAIRTGRELEQLGIRWFEEPLRPEDTGGLAAVAASLDLPVAMGETEATRWRFGELIEHRAADILQPDVTVVGGVSEWLKVAALASAAGRPVAPHYFPEVHAQLVAATACATTIEWFSPEADIISFDVFLDEPLRPRDGMITIPETPGAGLELSGDAVEERRVA
jgi:D-arabinonate dehydratase